FARVVLGPRTEPARTLIGNAVIALLNHPAELERLRADPSLVPNAVEEALRYDSPVQGLPRMVVKDVEVGGEKIPAGSRVMLMIGAANRDPQRWPDAARFDATRASPGHLGFGFGIPFCLGSHLARLESRCALEAVVTRLPGLQLAGEIVRTVNPILRGPSSLPVAFG